MARPNVSFLLGPQANVNTLLTTPAGKVQTGAFYLTEDSHRLYYGYDANNLVALNEGIITVESLSDLPGVTADGKGPDQNLTKEERKLLQGQFYYVSGQNVLCIFSGDNWVQINPDTTVNSLTVDAQAGDNSATIQTSLNNGSTDLSGSVAIKGGTNVAISVTQGTGTNPVDVITINGTVASIARTVASGKATVTLTDGTGTSSVVLEEGDNVQITSSGTNGIKISSTDFKLNAAGTFTAANGANSDDASLTLAISDATGATASATFLVEDDNTTTHVVKGSKSNAIKVEARKYDLAASATDNVASINLNSTLTGHTAITDDAVKLAGGANVQSITAKDDTITINTYDTYLETGTVNKNSGYTVEFNQTGGNGTAAAKVGFTINPTIKYGNSNETANFVNDIATLDVYTKAEVDSAIVKHAQQFNAMHYKGQVSSYANLPTSGVTIGDVWMLKEDDSAKGYKKGDLFIANVENEEDAVSGIITGTVKWDYVPAGDDVDTYALNMDGHGVVLNNGSTNAGEWHLAEGDKIVLSTSGKVTTIKHAEGNFTAGTQNATLTGATNAAGTSVQMTEVVTGLTHDKFGHVTGYKKGTLTVVDTHATLSQTDSSITASTTTRQIGTLANGETIGSKKVWTQTLKDTDGAVIETNWGIAVDSTNNSLAIVDDATNTATIQLVWGTF